MQITSDGPMRRYFRRPSFQLSALSQSRNVKIRNAIDADIEILVELQKTAPSASQWSDRQYQTAIAQGGTVVVIEDDLSVRGFLVAREVAREWEIENVIVAPDARRQGLGTRLLDEFFSRVRSADAVKVFLEVRESNMPARRLYELFGFAEDGRRKSYYRSPDEDAICYVVKLK